MKCGLRQLMGLHVALWWMWLGYLAWLCSWDKRQKDFVLGFVVLWNPEGSDYPLYLPQFPLHTSKAFFTATRSSVISQGVVLTSEAMRQVSILLRCLGWHQMNCWKAKWSSGSWWAFLEPQKEKRFVSLYMRPPDIPLNFYNPHEACWQVGCLISLLLISTSPAWQMGLIHARVEMPFCSESSN